MEAVWRCVVGAPAVCSSARASRCGPDRYAAAVAEVPFVDVVTTMSDPSLPLTVTEWEEWGDPRAEPFASYIAGYSPYDNTMPADYPAIFVTAGLNDPRVSYHEPAKWVARLRSVGAGDAAAGRAAHGDGCRARRAQRALRRLARRGPSHRLPRRRADELTSFVCAARMAARRLVHAVGDDGSCKFLQSMT